MSGSPKEPEALALPPGIRERYGRWHIRVQLQGQEHSFSTGLKATRRNLSAAVKRLELLRAKAEAGEAHTFRLEAKPFSDAVRIFIAWAEGEYRDHPATAKRLATSMVSLGVFFDRTPLHTIGAGALEDFKTWRRSAGIREVTIRHDLHALSLLCQFGQKHNWCRKNVVREVSIPSDKDAIRQYVLTPTEEELYFLAAQKYPQLHDVARLILLQGLRPDEVLSIQPADVDLVGMTLSIRRGKTTAARRTLRLTAESAAILARRMHHQRWIFEGRAGQLRKVNLSHDKILRATKLSFVLYDLRHTFATRMAEAGCPLPTLAAILGHANLRTIGRYVHPSQEAIEAAMDRYAASGFRPAATKNDGQTEAFKGQEPKGEK